MGNGVSGVFLILPCFSNIRPCLGGSSPEKIEVYLQFLTHAGKNKVSNFCLQKFVQDKPFWGQNGVDVDCISKSNSRSNEIM